MTTYRILEPEDWGMRWARPPVTEVLQDPEIYIHHRAGNPHHTRPAEDVFYEMNEGAITQKGYSATDYDVLVHENTVDDVVTIGVARGPWLSAATRDRNEQGEAICALGYFHPGHSLSEHPSPAMIEGLARAVALTISRGWAASNAKVLGHRDNPAHPGATGCPGDYLYPHVPAIHARALELLNTQEPPIMTDRRIVYVLPPAGAVDDKHFLMIDAGVRYAIDGDREWAKEVGGIEVRPPVDRYNNLHAQVYGA